MSNFIKKNKLNLLVLLGLIILNLAFFGFNLNNFFLSDDFDWLNITKNTKNLGDYFTGNYYGIRGEGGSYRPMVNLVFWINYQIGGLNPLPYHLFNLIFHIGVCFLIYLIVLLLFEDIKEKKKIAILSAVFFSILPNHSEPVIWIAAIGDPLCTFFYFLSFYLYLLFRKKEKIYLILLSVSFFIIALLTKELAITLPLLILVWELYESKLKALLNFKDAIIKSLIYWLILIIYFVIRFLTTALIFGYYAREKFRPEFFGISKMFLSLVIDQLFYGKLRVDLTNFFASSWVIFIFLIALVALVFYILKQYKNKILILSISFFILCIPVLLLSFNNFNDEGERYSYLPSVIFCIFLAVLIFQIKKNKILHLVSAILIIYFLIFLINKNLTWNLSAQLSNSIVKNDLPKLIQLNNHEKVIFVSLPDNLDGAQVLRNGILQAINLFYPDNNVEAKLLNAYVRLTKQNYNIKILSWTTYPAGGFIAKTTNGKFWVTGYDRRETDDYTFELWNYNYNNYTSDTIRLILKKDIFKILIFNKGQLEILNK